MHKFAVKPALNERTNKVSDLLQQGRIATINLPIVNSEPLLEEVSNISENATYFEDTDT